MLPHLVLLHHWRPIPAAVSRRCRLPAIYCNAICVACCMQMLDSACCTACCFCHGWQSWSRWACLHAGPTTVRTSKLRSSYVLKSSVMQPGCEIVCTSPTG